MNDPNISDACDEDLLHDLEKEFMEMIMRGDYESTRYAMDESAVFNCHIAGLVMAILDSDFLPEVRDDLKKVLDQYVAPQWARAHFDKRVAEMRQGLEEAVS